jgi:hypothetical protein
MFAPRHAQGFGKGVALLSLALSLGFVSQAAARPAEGPAGTQQVVAHIAQEEDSVPLPESVAVPIRRARTALKAVNTRFQRRQYALALQSLGVVRLNVSKAHKAGMAQIGAPPTDPESDDPPGPVSVVAVLNLEHGVGTAVVKLFNGMTRPGVVMDLRYTLRNVHVTRDKMLNAVIALPPEGAGADYADDMADTVGIYGAEVTLVTTALKQYRLSESGRIGLRRALARVRATQKNVNTAFGGGE